MNKIPLCLHCGNSTGKTFLLWLYGTYTSQLERGKVCPLHHQHPWAWLGYTTIAFLHLSILSDLGHAVTPPTSCVLQAAMAGIQTVVGYIGSRSLDTILATVPWSRPDIFNFVLMSKMDKYVLEPVPPCHFVLCVC